MRRVWSWFHGLGSSITGSIIATVVVAAVVAGWSTLKWPWQVAAGVFALAFLFVLATINQITTLVERVQIARRNSASPGEIKAQIRDWLFQMRYSVQDAPEAHFNFVLFCRNAQNIPFHIFQNEAFPSTVSIDTWINIIEDEHQRFLNRTPELLSNIRMEMARLGVGYSGIAPPVTKLTARIDLPWGSYFTAYVLQQAILYVLRARSIMDEIIVMGFTKAGITIGVPTPPQLPRSDGGTAH